MCIVIFVTGFKHFYRVDYDMNVWAQIQDLMRSNPDYFSQQARMQLISDFCYFHSQGTAFCSISGLFTFPEFFLQKFA